ncbi:MAG: hypothetical protein AAFU71_04885 [Cyanobacteria bacterium J06632_22]
MKTNPTPDQSSANPSPADHPVSEQTPEKVYENLNRLGQVDVTQGAAYRRAAIAVLADTSVSLEMRTAIADRLGQVNHLLSLKNVDPEESY